MGRILVVEDALDCQAIVKGAMGRSCELTCVENGSDAISALERHKYDLVLVDLTLPDVEGYFVCKAVRRSRHNNGTPIIVISGRQNAKDRVLAFSAGANDYISKPLDSCELAMRAELRIHEGKRALPSLSASRSGQLTLDSLKQCLTIEDGKGSIAVILTPIEARLLSTFFTRESSIVSRAELLRVVWAGVTVSARTVDKHVSLLRAKLGPYGDRLRTVHGVGYSLDFSDVAHEA